MERLSQALALPKSSIFLLKQTHSDRTVVLDRTSLATRERIVGPADGAIVPLQGIFAVIRTADCVPVIVLDPALGQFALFHVGWRGAKDRIVEKGLRQFMRLTGATPDSIKAVAGPCIRECCYQVGDDVRSAFAGSEYDTAVLFSGSNLSLPQTVRVQLGNCGVTDYLDAGLCTACRTDLFYSYRREATVSRMWTLAGFRRS